jgi:hypothetical protein
MADIVEFDEILHGAGGTLRCGDYVAVWKDMSGCVVKDLGTGMVEFVRGFVGESAWSDSERLAEDLHNSERWK